MSRPPTLAESVGVVLSAVVCALFGHIADEAVPFCLWCGVDLSGPRRLTPGTGAP